MKLSNYIYTNYGTQFFFLEKDMELSYPKIDLLKLASWPIFLNQDAYQNLKANIFASQVYR